MIPITKVDLGPTAAQLVSEVLESGRLAQGPMVERLEDGFRSIAGTKHAAAVSNGTVALVAAIEALDLSPGDEVITSPFTFVASLNAILEAGATVKFVDIGDDYCIQPDALDAAIGDRTKAIMPVHLYGLCADMGPIVDVCERREVALVEDAAQAHLAECDGKRAGSFGTGCFSLYATKNLTSGEGGIVTTNDDELADWLTLHRNQGMRARYQYEAVGHNWRMTELQAAVGVSQLPLLEERTNARRKNAALLNEMMADIEHLVLPFEPEGRRHVWHQYTVRVAPESAVTRDQLSESLNEAGIGNGIYYPRVAFDYDCYRRHGGVIESPVPNADAAAAGVLSLPVHPYLTDSECEQIAAAVRVAMAG